VAFILAAVFFATLFGRRDAGVASAALCQLLGHSSSIALLIGA